MADPSQPSVDPQASPASPSPAGELAAAPAPEASTPLAQPPRSTRRVVLQLAGVGVAGLAVGAATPVVLNKLAGPPLKVRPWRFLTDAEVALVDAVCEQIIPADQDPGAKDAGVVIFIDRQLAGVYQRFQDKYRKGLAALQATCQQLHKKNFEQLAWDDQTKLLQAVESGKVPQEIWKAIPPKEFFGLIVAHTMQGFYGSPRHGGNKNYASYKMLGLEYPRVMGRNRHG